MSTQELRQQAQRAETQLQTLLNNDLKAICKSEALLISGVKSVLQARIRQRMQDLVETGDAQALRRLTDTIAMHAPPSSQTPKAPVKDAGYPVQSLPTYPPSHRPSSSTSQYGGPPSHQQNYRQSFTFKKSVFYDIIQPIVSQTEMPGAYDLSVSQLPRNNLTLSESAVGQHRNTVSTEVRISEDVYPIVKQSTGRIMLFCCADPGSMYAQQPQDIAFPNQIEVRVNGQHFSGNMRGLKKKPGTTSPADITGLLTLTSGARNQVSITYAATERKYYVSIHLVRKYDVGELVKSISSKRFISKQQVINDMLSKAKDDDIEAMSSIMSLKCPISTMRMTLPCRSTVCVHNQCFDASSFLQAQMQAPQWSCPVCYKVFDFEALAVDQYVQDILQKTSSSTDQVTIEPDGQWKQGNQINGTSTKRKASEAFGGDDDDENGDDDDDDDDDVIITKSGINGFSTPASQKDSPGGVKLPQRAGASGTPNSTAQRSASKKPPPEVIDLTLSSDEEDAPTTRPQIKRAGSRSNMVGGGGLSGGSPTYPNYPGSVTVNLGAGRNSNQTVMSPRYGNAQPAAASNAWYSSEHDPYNHRHTNTWGRTPSTAYGNYQQQQQPAQSRFSMSMPQPRQNNATGNTSPMNNMFPNFGPQF